MQIEILPFHLEVIAAETGSGKSLAQLGLVDTEGFPQVSLLMSYHVLSTLSKLHSIGGTWWYCEVHAPNGATGAQASAGGSKKSPSWFVVGWGSARRRGTQIGTRVGQARNLDYGLAYRAASPLALAGQLKPQQIRMDLTWFRCFLMAMIRW